MDVERSLVQRMLLLASNPDGLVRASEEAFEELGSQSLCSEQYRDMLREQIGALMCEAFRMGDSLRWGRLAEHLQDKMDAEELSIDNLAFSILAAIFAPGTSGNRAVPISECTNVEGIAVAAYELAKLALASRPPARTKLPRPPAGRRRSPCARVP